MCGGQMFVRVSASSTGPGEGHGHPSPQHHGQQSEANRKQPQCTICPPSQTRQGPRAPGLGVRGGGGRRGNVSRGPRTQVTRCGRDRTVIESRQRPAPKVQIRPPCLPGSVLGPADPGAGGLESCPGPRTPAGLRSSCRAGVGKRRCAAANTHELSPVLLFIDAKGLPEL